MSRREAPEIESAGSDSFLDVVTNICGILIILVMVVGERARRTVIPVVEPAPTLQVDAELGALNAKSQKVEGDVQQLSAEVKRVQMERDLRQQERLDLATRIAIAEKLLAEERNKLSATEREAYDLDRKLALAKNQLQQLESEHQGAAEIVPASIEIKSYPTPLAKPVDGKELHLQLRAGRVTIVPLDELVERLKRSAPERARRLLEEPDLTDTVGPVDGFYLRYTLERVGVASLTPQGTGGYTSGYVQVSHFELQPVSDDLGEPLEKALSPTSALRGKLDTMSPRQWTVTLWTYSDSFEAFRALRQELYHLGYSVAGRPLPLGIPIGGSPRGAKSAAQ